MTHACYSSVDTLYRSKLSSARAAARSEIIPAWYTHERVNLCILVVSPTPIRQASSKYTQTEKYCDAKYCSYIALALAKFEEMALVLPARLRCNDSGVMYACQERWTFTRILWIEVSQRLQARVIGLCDICIV